MFILDNKRLDEWVTVHRLDTSRIQPPRVDEKKKSQASTPAPSPAPSLTKQTSPGKAKSPEREQVFVNGLQPKKGSVLGRKRKANALMDEVSLQKKVISHIILLFSSIFLFS